VQGLEELTFGIISLQFGVCAGRKEAEKCGGHEKF